MNCVQFSINKIAQKLETMSIAYSSKGVHIPVINHLSEGLAPF